MAVFIGTNLKGVNKFNNVTEEVEHRIFRRYRVVNDRDEYHITVDTQIEAIMGAHKNILIFVQLYGPSAMFVL